MPNKFLRPSRFLSVFFLLAACSDNTTADKSPVLATPTDNQPRAASLAFIEQPQTMIMGQSMPRAVVVEVRDQFGNGFPSATGNIQLALTAGSGSRLLHSSEDSLEVIDPAIPALVQPLIGNGPTGNILATVWDSALKQIVIFDQDGIPWSFEPKTLTLTQLNPPSLPTDHIKGLAYDVNGTTLFALLSNCCGTHQPIDALYNYDVELGQLTNLGTLTPDQGVIQSFHGLAAEPVTGRLFAAVELSGAAVSGSALMTIDPALLTARLIGDLGQRVAGLSFGNDGTLFAVSESTTLIAAMLHSVNQTTAAMTPIFTLGFAGTVASLAALPLLDSISQPVVQGVASFSALRLPAVGNAYKFTASYPGLPNLESSAFEVLPPVIDGSVSFDSAATIVHEDDGVVIVPITLSKAKPHEVILDIAVGGSALGNGIDYEMDLSRDRLVTIPAGQTSAHLALTLLNELLPENDETIAFTIRSAALAALGGIRQHVITIAASDLGIILQPSKDNTLYESATGDISNGGGTIMLSGRTNQTTGSRRRALFAFDVGSQVAPGTTVVEVSLELTLEGVSGGSPASLKLHRLVADWNEGTTTATSQGQGEAAALGDVTWLHRYYNTIFWNNPGGDFVVLPSATTEVTDAVGVVHIWSSPTMVSDVQAWVDDPASNFGWVLLGDETAAATNKKFFTRESTTGQPHLLITTGN